MAAIEEKTTRTLDLLEPGSRARVVQLQGNDAARRQVLDMGMVPGVMIEVIKKAPLGDPIEFEVNGYHMSLGRTEVELVGVQPLGDRIAD
jgi:ferrous iron transport protein A